MKARYTMEPRPSVGGYEITRDGERGLLPTGERVAKIFERWQQLQAVSPAVADAYLEGVTDGIKYDMT